MAAELRKLGAAVDRGRRLHRGHAAGAVAARRDPHLRRPPHGDVPVAGRLQPAGRHAGSDRPGLPVRILDPRCVAKTFPDYFETLFGVVSAEPAGRAGDHRRRPHRLGQGHAGRGAGAARWATTCWTPARCTAPRRWPRCRTAWPTTMPLRWRASPRGWTCASTASASCCAARSSTTNCVWRMSAPWPRKVSACPPCARPCTGCNWPSAAPPGLVADGRDMGTVVFPAATLKVFLTASAAQRAMRRHKQLISKGIQANIDRPSCRPRGARCPGQVPQRRTLEAGRRCVVARQLGAVHRRIGRCRAGLVAAAPAFRLKPGCQRSFGRRPKSAPPFPAVAVRSHRG